MNNNKCHGFTLLEVIVALFIIAIVMAGLLQATALVAKNKTHLNKKTIAGWVAQNQYYEFVLDSNKSKMSGQEKVFDYDFSWTITTENTLGIGFIKAKVKASFDETSHTLTGYKIIEPSS